MYRTGLRTWRRGNPFVPFPFPRPWLHLRRLVLYPLWPWQKYFWVMPPNEVEYRWHFGPVFIVK